MVRLQICFSNFKIYLKNYVVGPCENRQISGLWMNSGWCKVAFLSSCWWDIMSSLFSSLSCQCTCKRRFQTPRCLKYPSALGAGQPAHWRCSLTHFQPGAAFRMELSLSSWYSSKFAVLFNLLPVTIKGVRTPSRIHGKDGRFKKEIENTVGSNLCFSLELGNTTSVQIACIILFIKHPQAKKITWFYFFRHQLYLVKLKEGRGNALQENT